MEKIVIDAEMLRGWAAILKPVDFTDDDLGLDAIKGVAPGGHFFGSPHTLARYETAFYRPIVSDWSNFENWRDAGSRTATERAHDLWKKSARRVRAAAARSRHPGSAGRLCRAGARTRSREARREPLHHQRPHVCGDA